MTSKLETKGVRVFLGNVPFEAQEKDMRAICELAGRVVEFRFVMDNRRGRHKGTGFCEYPDVDTAQAAIRNLNKYPLRGRELIVDWADNEMKSKQSLSKILTLDQFDQVGNRISGLMKRSEQEVQKIDPQDASLLGEVAQVMHNCKPAELLYCLAEIQRMAHTNVDGTKNWLRENPLVTHALGHAVFLLGLTDDSTFLREKRNKDQDDDNAVLTQSEEEILRARSKRLREKLFGKAFKPITKKEVNLQFLRRIEKMSQAEVFEYLRNLKPEEIAALPTELQLQAQAVRASAKDTHEERETRRAEQRAGGEKGGGYHGDYGRGGERGDYGGYGGRGPRGPYGGGGGRGRGGDGEYGAITHGQLARAQGLV
eukprot:g13563.t1